MSQDTKKVEKTEATELSDQDLNKATGGTDAAPTQKVQHTDLSITKNVDIASPNL
jgi:type VI protein secretion system component Hcp